MNLEFATATFDEEHSRPSAALQGTTRRAIETRLLKHGEEEQVLKFLARKPLQSVMLRGSILDYGLESVHNRGLFYGCFRDGSLQGVALIGHNILLQGCPEAMVAFADVARCYHESEARLLLGEEAEAESFRRLLLSSTSGLRVISEKVEILLALTAIKVEAEGPTQLRLAQAHEAEEVSQINARGHIELNGFDPSTQDSEGFVERSRARIRKGRVWLVRDDKGIAFKADVTRVTDEAVYLEGVLTRPDLRGTGLGGAAFGDLCRRLLWRHDAVCVLVDVDSQRALAFYRRFGFSPVARYCYVRFDQLAP